MDFTTTIEKYGLKGTLDGFYRAAPDFEPSPTFANRYLSRDWFVAINRWLELPLEALEALIAAAAIMARDADLTRLCDYCRHVFFECDFTPESLSALGCPLPRCQDMPVNDLFGLIAHLSGIEVVRRRYARQGIPDSVMRDTYRTVRIWLEAYRTTFGRWGFNRAARGNPRMHYVAALRLFRLGRLEFESNAFPCGIVGLRHRQTGQVEAVLEGGTQLRRDGLINGTNDRYDPQAVVCDYRETESSLCAHPLLPQGLGVDSPRSFDLTEWQVILRRGYAFLNVHIPRGGKLDTEACRDAFAAARSFFPRYFPDRALAVFGCQSWLLDEQFGALLPPESNIVRFGALFHRFPIMSGDQGIRDGVFNDIPTDICAFTPKTALERALVAHYRQGGLMHNTGGFIPVSCYDGCIAACRKIKGQKRMALC